jgi:hypothetical protein
MGRLRIGLTISGAISLGAYEAGALAVLLIAAQERPDALVIDAVSGASAGAMTGLLAAHTLIAGRDPVDVMVRSWVDLPDIDNLKTHDLAAPLSTEAVERFGADVLFADEHGQPHAPPQTSPIAASFSLTSLGGLGYKVVQGPDRPAVDSVTHLDRWFDVLSPDSDPEVWRRALEAALVSGANAIGFPPRLYEHTGAELALMEANGVSPLPDGPAWYTDGGTVDDESFGRLIDILPPHEEVEAAGDARVVVLVHPTPTGLPEASLWTSAEIRPGWLRTAVQAQGVQRSQSLLDDLQSVAKTNQRVAWLDLASAAVAEAIEDTVDHDQLQQIRDSVAGAFDTIAHQQAGIRAAVGRAEEPPAEAPPDLRHLVEQLMGRATGLADKQNVTVEVVSPALDESGEPASDLLAGEGLGHFFGFTAKELRQSDFNLGWKHMTTWVRDVLPTYGVDDVDATILRVVEARRLERSWRDVERGGADWGDIDLGDKLEVGLIAAHVAHVAEHDLLHWGGTEREGGQLPDG